MPSKQKVEEREILFLDFELFIGGQMINDCQINTYDAGRSATEA
jgi:hypothetical protein